MARASDEPAYKLSVGEYRYGRQGSGSYSGQDLNLRWRQGDANAWLGGYRDPSFGTQARAGVDTTWALNDWLGLQPSMQLATRGFVGGSLNVMGGRDVFALLGWGRTNLRPYFNLNFDPNDAITLGAGWRGDQGRAVAYTVVADNRLHTGQRHQHLTARWPLAPGVRVTADVLRKTGDGDTGAVKVWGYSATLDLPAFFLRLARDPKQNFTAQDVTRFSAGLRF